jgi:competence protein ComEC
MGKAFSDSVRPVSGGGLVNDASSRRLKPAARKHAEIVKPTPSHIEGASDLFRLVMRVAPLFPVALGLILGIVLDGTFRWPWWAYFMALALCSVWLLRGRLGYRSGPLKLCLTAMCCGGLLHAGFARWVPSNSVERLADPTGPIVKVSGVVIGEPRLIRNDQGEFINWSYRTDRSSFVMQVESVDGVSGPMSASGRLHVSIREAVLDLREGERIELLGRLYPLSPPSNPGEFDWARFQRRQGVVGYLVANHRESVRRVEPAVARAKTGYVDQWREWVRGLLVSDLTEEAEQERSLLEAMVIGHRSRVDRRLNEVFIDAGCAHFLAVSGVHVVIVMFIARLACGGISMVRILLGGPKLRRITCVWLMLITVIAYMLLAEPRPPILRAGTIAIVYLIACMIGRERTYINWIPFTVIVLALIDPAMVFDIGYQLSTVAVLGVSYLSPSLKSMIRDLRGWYDRRIRGRRYAAEDRRIAARFNPGRTTIERFIGRLATGASYGITYFTGALAVSLGAWLVTLPIIAIHFQRLHLWGAIASMALLPLVTVVMALGFAKMVTGPIVPELATWLAIPLERTDAWLIRLVYWFSDWPNMSIEITPPPWWLVAAWYALILAVTLHWPRVALFIRERNEEPLWHRQPGGDHADDSRRYLTGYAPALCLLVLLIAGLAWFKPPPPKDSLTLTVLSVGAGSVHVMELPEGQTIFYDVGSQAHRDVGRRVAVPFLQARGIRRVDRVYLSHANMDHFSGLPGLIEHIPTGPVIVNKHFEQHATPRSPARHLLTLLRQAGHPLETLDDSVTQWHYGGADFELLWPLGADGVELRSNDASTVLRISYAGRSIMLPGDIVEEALRRLLDRGGLHADVLVLPHHGDVKPSTQAFIEAVDAEILIRASHETMNMTYNGLENIIGKRRLYNTADHGAVAVELRAPGLSVRTHLDSSAELRR